MQTTRISFVCLRTKNYQSRTQFCKVVEKEGCNFSRSQMHLALDSGNMKPMPVIESALN